MKKYLFLFLMIFLSGIFFCFSEDAGSRQISGEKIYKMIPLGTVPYYTVDRTCRPWLSKEGILTHEEPRASILVYDTPEVIVKIAEYIKQLQPAIYNIRTTVDYVGSSSGTGASFGTVGKKIRSGQKWNSRTQPQPTIQINRQGSTSNTSMVLMSGNGLPATIWSGKTIIDPSWIRAQTFVPDLIVMIPGNTLRIPGSQLDLKWADVGAKLMIRPYYDEATGNVTLELYPALSYLEGNKHKVLKVESLSTTVTIRPGQRVGIGGVLGGKRDTLLNIFGPDFFSSGNNFTVTDIYLTCEVLSPGDKRNSTLRRIP